MIRDIGALNEEMDAAGARFFAGGLESASHAKSLRKQLDGKVSITDGPYLEAKEHIGGFWILECADMDEALAWGRKAVVACRVPVEVRAFHKIRPNGNQIARETAMRKLKVSTTSRGRCNPGSRLAGRDMRVSSCAHPTQPVLGKSSTQQPYRRAQTEDR